MKKIFVILFASLCLNSFGTHIVGGDLTVQHINGNTFKVELRFYRDCGPTSYGFDTYIPVGMYDKITNARMDSLTLNLTSVTPLSLGDACYAPNLCVEEGLYTATVIIPNNPNGYYLSWQRCCRNGTIDNIVNPLAAGLAYYVEIPDPAIANSSPVFGSYTKTYMCVGSPTTINFSATDINNDNLVYSLINPLNGVANSGVAELIAPGPYPTVTWQSPYSLSNILGSSPNVSINPTTGVLTVTPTVLGTFVFAVKVEEFRGGVKIGEITRDIQYQVINCINPVIPGPAITLTCTTPTDTISASSSGLVSSYNWAGPSIVSGGSTATPIVGAAGTYTVTTTSPSGCTYTAVVVVTMDNAAPNLSTGGGIALTCQNASGSIGASSTTPGATYAWTGPGITAGANTANPTVTLAGTYTVTVTNPINGCTSTGTVVVTGSSNLPNVSTTSNLTITCTTTSGTISASSTTPGVNYVWSGPGIVSGGNTTTPTVNAGGTYTVTVTNPSNGCTSVATVVVNDNLTPPNVSTPTATIITCNSPTSTINVSSTMWVNYSWSGPGIVSGGSSGSPIVNAPGTYTVVVTNTANGCTNTASVVVNNNIVNPNVIAGSTLTLTCTSTSGSISASSTTANAGYVWAGPGITANGNTASPSVNATGTYTVTVTDPINGCTSTATVVVNNNIVVPNAVAGTNLILTCTAGSGQISASSTTANVSYAWAGPNIVSGSTTATPTVNASGTYTVVITDPINGCTNTATVNVTTDNSIPTLSATSSLTLTCNNITDTIFAVSTPPNVTYQWTPGAGVVSGATTPNPVVNAPGTYTVVVTNPASGCTNLTTVTVINNVIYPVLSAGPSVILNCLITSDTLTVNSSTTGMNYSWSGSGIVSGATTPNPIVNAAGTYTVTVTNPTNGCTSTAVVSVTNNNTPPNLTAGAAITLTCTTTSSTISAGSTTAGVTYSWSGSGIVFGGNTATPIVNGAGTYTVTVTNPVNGCTSTATVVVNSNVTPPNVTAGAALILTCNITSSAINANSSTAGVLYNWSGPSITAGSNTSSPTVNGAGTYTVTVTDPANGCTSSTTVTVTNAPLPIAGVNAAATVITLGNSTTLTATGGGTYQWIPTTGLSCATCATTVATPTVSTTYCVVVTDQYGCNDTACVKVNVFDPCPFSNNGFLVPNIFSPNDDGSNDVLLLKDWNNECIVDFGFEIYDRWGLKMFQSEGANVHWDGRTASGLICPAGTYYYIGYVTKLRAEPKIFKGFVMLVR